ncbi:hypothetical protein LJC34_00460 [Oscillospiraceae bacterium OttesenSCG-928-G22]|nr:hypothetical protein [Oscillospiraceae bacterium OttesenSCG-928-G22]
MPPLRKLVTRDGKPLPINEDGTVVRRSAPTPTPVRAPSPRPDYTGYVYTGPGTAATIFYYIFKALMMILSVGAGLAAMYFFGLSLFQRFFTHEGYGLLTIIVELVEAFFPLLSVVCSAVASIYYVAAHVEIDGWAWGFLGPVIALVALGISGLLLFLIHLALLKWWGVLILFVALSALGGLSRDD